MSTDEIISRARLLENDIKVILGLFCGRAGIIVTELGPLQACTPFKAHHTSLSEISLCGIDI